MAPDSKHIAGSDGDDNQTESNSNSQLDASSVESQDATPPQQRPFIIRLFNAMRLNFFFLLYAFGKSLNSTSERDMFMYKSCRFQQDFNSTVCSNLNDYEVVKTEAEKTANLYSLYSSLVSTVPSVVIATFLGPWCKMYGYKIPVLVGISGAIVSTTGDLVTVVYMSTPMYVNILTKIPVGFSGGYVAVFTAVYAYVTKDSTPELRTKIFYFLELLNIIGTLMGTFIGGAIFSKYGYLPIYESALGSLCVSFALAAFVLKDTATEHVGDALRTKLRNFFRLDNFIESARVFMRKREHNVRIHLNFSFVILCGILVATQSIDFISYPYTKHMYGWSLPEYNNVNTIASICIAVGATVLAIVLMNVIKWADTNLLLMGTVAIIGKNVSSGLAFQEWLYYLGFAFQAPSALALVGVKAYISKIIERSEIGTVFAFLSSCETLMPILGQLIITFLYNWSLDFFAGLSYLFCAVLMLPSFFLLIYMVRNKPPSALIPLDEEPPVTVMH